MDLSPPTRELGDANTGIVLARWALLWVTLHLCSFVAFDATLGGYAIAAISTGLVAMVATFNVVRGSRNPSGTSDPGGMATGHVNWMTSWYSSKRQRVTKMIPRPTVGAKKASSKRQRVTQMIPRPEESAIAITPQAPEVSDPGSALGQGPSKVYFISYSRANKTAADRLELLLRRSSRGVWRDKTNIREGAMIVSSLHEGIDESHTFICMLSREYVQSGFCLEELEKAIHREINTRTPRVLIFRIDDVDPPSIVRSRAWTDISTEDKLSIAVSKAIEEEA